VVTSNLGGLSTAQVNALSPSGANAQLGQATDAIKDQSLSGQLGVSYHVSPDIMVYATAARGYKSKGFNLLPYNATNPDPSISVAIAHGAAQDIAGETADNLEAGFKSEWLDHRLLVNLTVFNTEVENYQANQSIGVGNTATKFLANVGSMRSRGAELKAEAQPLEGLHFKGLVAYEDATYTSFHNSVCPAESSALSCDLTGRQVAWAPKWTSDLTTEYSRSLFANTTSYVVFDVNWRSSQNTTITLDPAAEIKGYALANLRVGTLFDSDQLDVQVWCENLLDKALLHQSARAHEVDRPHPGYPGNPRTFGVTLRYHF
jgi:iron complex outermembrane receptor protein